jgi:hypothetical protein
LRRLWQLAPRGLELEVEIAGESLEKALEVVKEALSRLGPGQDGTVGEADGRIRNEQLGIHRHLGAES